MQRGKQERWNAGTPERGLRCCVRLVISFQKILEPLIGSTTVKEQSREKRRKAKDDMAPTMLIVVTFCIQILVLESNGETDTEPSGYMRREYSLEKPFDSKYKETNLGLQGQQPFWPQRYFLGQFLILSGKRHLSQSGPTHTNFLVWWFLCIILDVKSKDQVLFKFSICY